ncbi:uncharacterized protein OCT59_010823 [Rhizophagus irregularis]|uniref:Uncharacterized protein n=1 Tax=Rhizophagus irregularis TaxID=588596 RepID=A0A915ZK91_9GLOM|nr:hypothetical protein OCT59_010823 [Rhizophagus irregularis]CAB5377732.1 unnamed protein product [Rhizophagus irregularis]
MNRNSTMDVQQYLIVVKKEIQEKEGSEVIALDPDVRTFMTGYDPSGIAVEWGKNDIGQLSHIMSCYVTYSQEDPLSL